MTERFLRTACVQLSPCFKDWDASRLRAEALIAGLVPGELDLLVLPEMAFTGYCFQSKEDVEEFAEAGDGPTFRWAASTACGTDQRPIYHNSLLVVGPDGAQVHTYHKTFLYGELTNDRADYLWAEAGTGFVALDLPFPSSSPFHAVAAAANNSASHHSAPSTFRLVPAICMDLNMPTFDAPFEKFELATFASEKRADIVVGSMAWLDSEPPLDSSEDESQRDDSGDGKDAAAAASQWEEVRSVISYWVLRLSPLIGSGAAFVCANRVGREGDVVFTGSSCALELSDRPCVIDHAGKRGEKVVIARVSLPASQST
ncbi:Carbon-nitrogen hydrolase [Rhodotorula mucilaginosa]|uniref:Carbon-nitrogen hydrolase n=1 Tax=Rhodotorula mucilaginosa TaxID=5537 RepID=A0A9P6VZ53_RHOMI|nr:Carbon-nitrogen hydrolase [Rhodotorula mucilaginosa]